MHLTPEDLISNSGRTPDHGDDDDSKTMSISLTPTKTTTRRLPKRCIAFPALDSTMAPGQAKHGVPWLSTTSSLPDRRDNEQRAGQQESAACVSCRQSVSAGS